MGKYRFVERASTPALETRRRDRKEARWTRRNGLYHAVPADAVHARGSGSGYGCLRCGYLVGTRSTEQDLGGKRECPRPIPRLYPRTMAGTFCLANSHTKLARQVLALSSINQDEPLAMLLGFILICKHAYKSSWNLPPNRIQPSDDSQVHN